LSIEQLVSELEAVRQTTLDRYSGLEPDRLSDVWEWRGSPSTRRFMLSWLSEGSESRRVRILSATQRLGHRFTDAHRAVMLLGASRGHLRGKLIGLLDEAYDLEPAPGEWSVRRVLGHVIATDERYGTAVSYATERMLHGGTGLLRPDESTVPPRTGEAQSTGTPAELRARLQQVRLSVLGSLAAVPDDLLVAPTNWTTWDVDVRFRIHRFSAHDREHTIQIDKALRALGILQTEPQLLLADAMVELSALEALLVCVGDSALNRQPRGASTIDEIVRESLEEERALG
jgi:hypothetical protein